jgi:hypothetical protein
MNALNQARRGIKNLINEDFEFVTINRKPMVDDGYGSKIEDPTGDPVPYEIKCRISHQKKFTDKYNVSPPGMSTNLSRFIFVDFETIIYEGDIFESERIAKSFKIGIVDPLEEYGGIIGYQAPLEEADDMGV